MPVLVGWWGAEYTAWAGTGPPTWALVPLATLTTGRGAGHSLGLGRGSRTWVLRDFDDANVSLFLSRGVETGSHLAAAA